MQKQEKKRQTKMTREQQLKHKENMELPINKFLNAKTDKGEIKYPVAEKLRKYFMNNPDPILTDMRLANALLHEIRWHKKQSTKYLISFEGKVEVSMLDKYGKVMEKDDCYLAHISSQQNIHISLSKLREHLSNKLLSKCDGEYFTFDQYNEFVGKVEKILEKEGLDLFPEDIKLIEPL